MLRLSTMRAHVLTWNVVGHDPEEDLCDALGISDTHHEDVVQKSDWDETQFQQVIHGTGRSDADANKGDQEESDVLERRRPDIYAVGLQEVSATPQSVIMGTLGFEDPWTKRFRETLAPYGYVKLKSIRLLGLLLILFIERRHLTYVRGVQTEYTRTGLRRMWGNKGAVTIRINVYGCSVCFVNCHLAAHEGELQQRIEDYNTIVDTQVFADPETENILYHDYVFWMGDLNFRITGYSAEEINRMARAGQFDRLLEHDQLATAMKSGEAFAEFKEVRPAFRPSYKFRVGADEYDLQRRPSWTDRILFKANPDVYENVTLTIVPRHYRAHDGYLRSDHKPVSASYAFKVFQGYVDHRVVFVPSPKIWYVRDDVQCFYRYQGDVVATSWDWIGLYKADFTSVDDYVTYVWAASASTSSPSFSSATATESSTTSRDGDRDDGVRFWVTFPQVCSSAGAVGGSHRLLYVSSDAGNILGMSEPFQIAAKH